MTMPADDEARKTLLVAQAELQRVRMALAVHDIRNVFSPSRRAASAATGHLRAITLLKYTIPLLGVRRMSRLVRYATIALTVMRVARAWRRSGD